MPAVAGERAARRFNLILPFSYNNLSSATGQTLYAGGGHFRTGEAPLMAIKLGVVMDPIESINFKPILS